MRTYLYLSIVCLVAMLLTTVSAQQNAYNSQTTADSDIDTDIRNKTDAGSITPDILSDVLSNLAATALDRGSGALKMVDTSLSTPEISGPVGVGTYLAFEPFSQQCDIRLVTAVSTNTVTLDRALTDVHESGDNVLVLPAPIWNVRLFGAKGDDSTDDHNTIQAAINDCNGNGGGVVYLPEGTYLIGNGTDYAHSLDLYSNITLKGDGIATVVKSNKNVVVSPGNSAHKTNAPLVTNYLYRQSAEAIVTDVTIEGIKFLGQRGAMDTYDTDYEFYAGCAFSAAQNVRIRDCYFEEFEGDGILFENEFQSGPNQNVSVEGCYFNNCLRGGVTAVTGYGIRVHNNYFTGDTFAIHIEAGSGSLSDEIQDVHITNNTMNACTADTVVWMASGVNSVDANGSHIFANNTFRDCDSANDRSPMILFICHNSVFANNKFYDCDTDGQVFLEIQGTNCSFSGNTFYECTTGEDFIHIDTEPDSGAEDWSDRTNFSIIGNTFLNVKSDTGTLVTTSAFIQLVTTTTYCDVSHNVASIGGFYYGVSAHAEGMSFVGNVLNAVITIPGDSDPGIRGFFNGTDSTTSNVFGNTLNGWTTPIFRSEQKLKGIGHNMGDNFHEGFAATKSIGAYMDNGQRITLGAGVTTFTVTGNAMEITGDGGTNTIATITEEFVGQLLTLIFTDGNVTITDDNGHGPDTVDLSASFTSADDTVLQLIHNGTSWYEVSRSTN